MKQIIPYLFLFVLLCSSCIKEDLDDCEGWRNLTFSHFCLYDDNTNFDDWIANDVVLHVYQDKKLKLIKHIPYAQIGQGQTFSYIKQCEGEVDIVCWAVKNASATLVPSANIEQDYWEQLLTVQKRTWYQTHVTDLFLGTEAVTDDCLTENSTHHIKMINTAYLMTVNLITAEPLQTRADDLYVVVDGVMNTENLLYQGLGEAVETKADFSTSYTDGTYTTSVFGVLPSADAQTVSLAVYSGDTRIATVRTPEKAVAGGRMIVDINLGVSISIVVNDWDVYITDYEWM